VTTKLRIWLGLDKLELIWFEKLLLLAPIAIWFSYRPLMRLGQDDTMYFELSVTMIYLLILALSGLGVIFDNRKELLKDKAAWVAGFFILLGLISLAWTPNIIRGVLTVGVGGLLYIVLLACLARARELKQLLPALVKLYVVSAVAMSLLALLQMIAGIWLAPDLTLLCAGCVAEQFGFARPNVFAIEPQFFGSLLLFPALFLTWRSMFERWNKPEITSLMIVVTGLFLTMSRGAIFAFALGVAVLIAIRFTRYYAWLKTGGLLVASFAISLAIQGVVTAVNPNIDETFVGATSKVINQMTLGVIDISPEEAPVEQATPEAEATAKVPVRDGYVEESTDIRVNRSSLALQTWADNPASVVAGVGIGGAGVAVWQKFPDKTGAREIVQNQYVETLLEQGLIGLMVFVAMLAAVFVSTRSDKWLWAILAAFMFQWLFFSGYPNLIHVYLVLIIVYATARHVRLSPAKRY
jgi:hypothetical protein